MKSPESKAADGGEFIYKLLMCKILPLCMTCIFYIPFLNISFHGSQQKCGFSGIWSMWITAAEEKTARA